MSTAARITIRHEHGVAISRVHGEVDLSNAAEVEQQVLAAIPNSAAGLVVDLTGTAYLDSAGLRMLVELGRRLRQRQQEMRIAASPGTAPMKVLAVAGLDQAFPIHDSAGEAAAEIRGTKAAE